MSGAYFAGHTEEAQQLSSLVPRLWPFLSHTNKTVRQSCLQVLLSLMKSRKQGQRGEPDRGGHTAEGTVETAVVKETCGREGECGPEIKNIDVQKTADGYLLEDYKMDTRQPGKKECPQWLASILQGTLCQLFQRLALEGDNSNADLAHQVYLQCYI